MGEEKRLTRTEREARVATAFKEERSTAQFIRIKKKRADDVGGGCSLISSKENSHGRKGDIFGEHQKDPAARKKEKRKSMKGKGT